jgi:hypothetical protein
MPFQYYPPNYPAFSFSYGCNPAFGLNFGYGGYPALGFSYRGGYPGYGWHGR